MTLKGHVENGVVVIDEQTSLPDGTPVTIEIVESTAIETSEEDVSGTPQKRVGGQYRGKIWIAPDFDELPDDIAEAFGMREE